MNERQKRRIIKGCSSLIRVWVLSLPQTYLWVMNTEEDFRSAFETGATGVMTDYPTKLKTFLEENPQYCLNHKLSLT